jgi:hypothetical protein
MTGNPIADSWQPPGWVDLSELLQGHLTTRARRHRAFKAGRRAFPYRP